MDEKVKISLIKPSSINIDPWATGFKNRGIEVIENAVDSDCEIIICASISQLKRLQYFHNLYPNIPIINYNWDIYEWHKSQLAYDWALYGVFLEKSIEIWCPSEEVALRTEEFYGQGHKCEIVKTAAILFDAPPEKIKDSRYIFQPVRQYTKDRNYGLLRSACTQLNLPLTETNHRLSEDAFRKTILECSFMCVDYHEASTGGLTLIEGYRHGKPVLISDSKYMGAQDYFGSRAIYFKDGDLEDLKAKLLILWNDTPKYDLQDCIQFTNQYTYDIMIDHMTKRIRKCIKNQQ